MRTPSADRRHIHQRERERGIDGKRWLFSIEKNAHGIMTLMLLGWPLWIGRTASPTYLPTNLSHACFVFSCPSSSLQRCAGCAVCLEAFWRSSKFQGMCRRSVGGLVLVPYSIREVVVSIFYGQPGWTGEAEQMKDV
jgi:hypothetical protein